MNSDAPGERLPQASRERQQTVGFVGLGMMGAPMAENILKNGFPLAVHDLDPRKTEHLASLGAVAASDAADVARRASICISMVETTAQTEEVLLGPHGFIQAAQPGDLAIVMSTIDMMALKRMHPCLAERGVELIDAPVTGMRINGGAKAASLKCYVGGDAAALERARPILATMTSEITHFGAVGLGTAMKVVNNMLMQVNRVVIAEALAMGAKAGLDPVQMVEALGKTPGNSPAFQRNAPRMLARDFDGIRMGITAKDVELQAALGVALGLPMFMASAALQVHLMGKSMGLADKDAAALVEVYESFTGVPVIARQPRSGT